MLPELQPLITVERIQQKVNELGDQISNDYKNKNLLCVAILKGAIPFFADLIQAIQLPLETDFICVSSYGNDTKSSGVAKMVLDLGHSAEAKDILLIEDIVDTGLTINYVLENLKTKKPASLKVVTLLLKPGSLKNDVTVDYVGFEIGNDFVVGYGLDYAEKYRNLPYVAILPKELI